MAFSFDTLVNDQKQSAIDVVDAITPRQVRQLGAAYKAGLNTSPKQVINETLGEFTGIDFSQTAGIDGLGAQAKNFIEAKGADLAMQLEQQILGCINTAIRDLMNKHPEVDFILNFEDRINGILGKFRNKLERKIDEELRKLTYQKLKVQQIALFKQRLRQKIKNICPAATPASVSEVQDFNNKIKGLINKRKIDNQPIDITPTLKQGKIFVPKTETKTQAQTQPEPISEKAKKEYKKERVAKQVAKEKAQELKKEVEEETKKQLEQPEEEVIESLLDTDRPWAVPSTTVKKPEIKYTRAEIARIRKKQNEDPNSLTDTEKEIANEDDEREKFYAMRQAEIRARNPGFYQNLK